jgi:LPS export ABC transporter protein LptC
MQVIDILERHNNNTFSLFLFGLLMTIAISSCGELSEEQSAQVDEALSDSLTSTTESWDVDMEIIEDGTKKMRLLGSYAATYTTEDSSSTRIKGPVTIHLYDSTGTITTLAYSERAVYDADNAIFELFGDVRVNTADNRKLTSEYLKWIQSDNLIRTPKFVIITTPSDSIAGTGFEGTTDLSDDYTIEKPTGQFIVE